MSEDSRRPQNTRRVRGWLVGEVGLEPTKAKPADLQSAPFAARDTPPDPSARGRGRKRLGGAEARSAGLILRRAMPCQLQNVSMRPRRRRTRGATRLRENCPRLYVRMRGRRHSRARERSSGRARRTTPDRIFGDRASRCSRSSEPAVGAGVHNLSCDVGHSAISKLKMLNIRTRLNWELNDTHIPNEIL